jgi:hypothetical protein
VEVSAVKVTEVVAQIVSDVLAVMEMLCARALPINKQSENVRKDLNKNFDIDYSLLLDNGLTGKFN